MTELKHTYLPVFGSIYKIWILPFFFSLVVYSHSSLHITFSFGAFVCWRYDFFFETLPISTFPLSPCLALFYLYFYPLSRDVTVIFAVEVIQFNNPKIFLFCIAPFPDF